MLKRVLIVTLCLCLLLVLVACKKNNEQVETELPDSGTQNETPDNGATDNSGDTNTDQTGNQNTGSEAYYDPDTGGIVLPWVP